MGRETTRSRRGRKRANSFTPLSSRCIVSPSRVIGLRAGNAPTKDVLRGDAPSVHESGVGRAARIVVVDHPKAINPTCRGAILAVSDVIVELLLEGGILPFERDGVGVDGVLLVPQRAGDASSRENAEKTHDGERDQGENPLTDAVPEGRRPLYGNVDEGRLLPDSLVDFRPRNVGVSAGVPASVVVLRASPLRAVRLVAGTRIVHEVNIPCP